MTRIYKPGPPDAIPRGWSLSMEPEPKPESCKISWWEWTLATFLIAWGCKPTLREMLPFFAVSAALVLGLLILFG